MEFDAAFARMPIVAILRGLLPEDAEAVGDSLLTSGIQVIEVPLNSPDPFQSIERLATRFGHLAAIGAGTVVSVEDVRRTQEAGGSVIVAPNTDRDVISEAKKRGMAVLPGFFTASEAFAGLALGATALKLFPAEAQGLVIAKALRAVLPTEARLVAVGGVTHETIGDYFSAGFSGIGLGSALFRPGKTLQAIKSDAENFVQTTSQVLATGAKAPTSSK